MRPPATSCGGASRKGSAARRAAAPEPPRGRGRIKITRNTPRPQIKASRGSGGPAKRRTVADPRSAEVAAQRHADRLVAETRRQSLSSLAEQAGRASSKSSPKRKAARRPAGRPAAKGSPGGRPRSAGFAPSGGTVRAVAAGAGGSAAAGAARAVAEVARPVAAVARPALRVVSGGIERLPGAASSASPVARGRFLILLAGLMAAGLIYINVGKLEYGDGYGKYAARSLELERENTTLRAQIAHDSSAERIQRYASRIGMVVPAPEQYGYLRSRSGDPLKATRGYTAPNASLATPAPQTVTPSPATTTPAPTATTTPQTSTLQTTAPTQTQTTPQAQTPAATGGAGQ